MSSVSALLNPAPTSGALAKGAIPSANGMNRKGGLPSVGSLLNPSMAASVTEIQTNSTAAAPIFCKPFREGYEKKYSEGDIMWVKGEDANNSRSTSHHTVANLAVLNYFLRTERDKDQAGALARRTYRDGQLDKVLKHWKFFGIMLNDMDTSSQFQRLLNITVRGRCRLANYWSTDAGAQLGDRYLKKGDTVWIGFQLVTHQASLIIKNPDGSSDVVPATGDGGALGSEAYYQAVPVLYNPSGLLNEEYDKCEHVFPIGIIHQLPFKNTPLKRQKDARVETDKGKLLDRMEVFIRI